MAKRLFISHASEDAGVAERIVAYLEAHGAPCWIASRDIPPQAIYADAITAAMQECTVCAVLVSAASNASKAVKRELELASHYDKPFIPIRIDAAEPAAGLDYYLRNTQWLDYRRDGERALARIATQMQSAPVQAPRPTPPALAAPASPMRSLLILGSVLVIGLGAWFVWHGLARNGARANHAAAQIELQSLEPVLGSYHWSGVACGAGPAITQEGDNLIFTMRGTPTFRHSVVRISAPSARYSFQAQTEVTAPPESAGQRYQLTLSPDGSQLSVRSDGRGDVWERCGDGYADAPPAAPTQNERQCRDVRENGFRSGVEQTTTERYCRDAAGSWQRVN